MKQSIIYFTTIILLFLVSITLYMAYPKLFSSTDLKITSYYLKSKPAAQASKKITIIDIDEKSLNKLGQWPFSRDKIATVLQNLTNAGAGIIGIDIVFADKDRLSPHNMAKVLHVEGNFTDNDKLFSDVLFQTPTILGYFFNMSTPSNESSPLHQANFILDGYQNFDNFPKAYGVINNLEILKQSAYSSGFFNLTNIEDGTINKIPLVINYKNKLYPSLALEMLRIASDSQVIKVYNSKNGLIGLEIGDISIPTNSKGQMQLNFRNQKHNYTYISFLDILENNFDKQSINGNFIFIGTSEIGLNDRVSTIYNAQLPGVEIHATTIDNILNNDFFFTPTYANTYMLFILLFTTLILGTILYFSSPFYSVLIFTSSLGALIYLNYYFIFSEFIILNYSVALISIFFTMGIYTLISYYFENIQKKKIFTKLSSKVSPEVAKEILKHDENILQANKKELTILFSDIRNFTTISERLEPKKLIKMLNIYMEPMVETISEYNGTLDKFIGDALMAYFNAPLEVENHADMAVLSALKQLEKLKILNQKIKKEFGIELEIGIGINSGDAIVGEMGTKKRSDYTVIGDSVNLASRVENLTKLYSANIIITQQTKNLLKNNYEFKELDTIVVKGKHKETTIYEVLKQY